MHTALFSHSAFAYLISPLIWERKLQKFTVPSARWKCNIKACVFYIWQTPKPGPSAPEVHLSEMISLTIITHPCLTASLCVSVGRTVLTSLKMFNCNVKRSTHLSQKRQDKESNNSQEWICFHLLGSISQKRQGWTFASSHLCGECKL